MTDVHPDPIDEQLPDEWSVTDDDTKAAWREFDSDADGDPRAIGTEGRPEGQGGDH